MIINSKIFKTNNQKKTESKKNLSQKAGIKKYSSNNWDTN